MFKTNPVGTEGKLLLFSSGPHNHKAWNYSGARFQIKEFVGFYWIWVDLIDLVWIWLMV